MEETVRYAGFWRRVAAAIIDNLLIAVVLAPLLFLFTSGDYFLNSDNTELAEKLTHLDWGYLLINEVVPLVLVVFFWVRFQTTPGKYMLDCYVVDGKSFQALTIGQALLRYFGYLVSLLPLGLGFIWVAFDKRKRGFHDLIAGSVVVVRFTGPFETDESQKSLEKLMRESS
jgi:uncharacterized RDD family membrane protein YckC